MFLFAEKVGCVAMNTAFRPPVQSRPATRYTAVAILLHWVTALLVISMIPMGLWMVRAIKDPATQQLAYQLFQVHKSIGFAILALTVVRIVWRLTHPVPALPAGMKNWESFLAKATHVAFYGLMLALPLSGWIYISSGWAISTDRPLQVATSWFGLFGVPDLPGLEGNRTVAFAAMGAHSYLAWGGIVLIALHVAAALKHHVIDRDAVLAQMIPVLSPALPKIRAEHGHGASAPSGSAFYRAGGVMAVVVVAIAGCLFSLPAPLPIQADGQAEAPVSTAPAPVQAAANSAPAQDQASASTAKTWVIQKASSRIGFEGVHNGKPFTGQFEDWSGDIHFDPANLAASRASVTIKTGTAKTGDATQEGSLKNGEWFNSARYPDARFETVSFAALGGERYEAKGTLTIKNKSIPVVLPFTLKINGTKAHMEGALELDRAAINMGMFSDPAADWVSKAIQVKVVVDADAGNP
ncbi:cytochrome b/b6 domain-containing protein [Rhizobium oryziradicis]|nr:cytochrome b/b6 domain-containing protein [Rhizobium oryziradicis]